MREEGRQRERERGSDVSTSMTGRDNLIIILMWDVMNNSYRTDNTHKQIHTPPLFPLSLVQRHKPSAQPTTTLPKVSTSAFITWNNTLPRVHSSVPLRLMHCAGLQESFRQLLNARADHLRICLGGGIYE